MLRTAAGDVDADVVVLAGEAYLTQLRRLHRSLIPIWSLIVLTEPLPDERLGGDRLAASGGDRLAALHGGVPVANR